MGQEGAIVKILIATTVHDMIEEDPMAKYPHHIDIFHFTTISQILASLIGCAIVLTVLREL